VGGTLLPLFLYQGPAMRRLDVIENSCNFSSAKIRHRSGSFVEVIKKRADGMVG
jgi:hypothetical protein